MRDRERIKRGVKGGMDRGRREARLRQKMGRVGKERVKRAGEKNEGGVGGGEGARETVTDPHRELWLIVIDIQDSNDEHSL